MTEPLLDRLRHVDAGENSGGRPYRNPDGLEAAAEIERLHEVIRQIVEREATVTTSDGDIVIQMDAPFDNAERQALHDAITFYLHEWGDDDAVAGICSTLRKLLERTQ